MRYYIIYLFLFLLAACDEGEKKQTFFRDDVQNHEVKCQNGIEIIVQSKLFKIPADQIYFIVSGDGLHIDGDHLSCNEQQIAMKVHLTTIIFGEIAFPESTLIESQKIILHGTDYYAWVRKSKNKLSKISKEKWKKLFALKIKKHAIGIIEYNTGSNQIFKIPQHLISKASKDDPVVVICSTKSFSSFCKVGIYTCRWIANSNATWSRAKIKNSTYDR